MATGIEIWHYFQILQILQISMTGRKGLAGNSRAKARPGTDTQENNTACVKWNEPQPTEWSFKKKSKET